MDRLDLRSLLGPQHERVPPLHRVIMVLWVIALGAMAFADKF